MKTEKLVFIVSTSLWLFAVGAGLSILSSYSSAPGTERPAPLQWPRDSKIKTETGRSTLVMMVHPRCPCSRASIAELARLMTQAQGLLSARVIFWEPKGVSETWAKSDLWTSAAAIPGVTVMLDVEGEEARRFGGETSGQTFLYNAKGRLQFSGGITVARGHAGDNAGRSAILALVSEKPATIAATPVFGCSLLNPQTGGTKCR
ncbi:MAG: hypothetical protein JWM68_5863 [Verrucomicrobiales bacterium]|nr:hypothetical protein [Verrucomicrobiales bacterium]